MSKRDPAPPRSENRCHIDVDGTSLAAIPGQSLAAVMVAHGIWQFRRNAVAHDPRGPFCGMGVCFECEVTVDGRAGVRACMLDVRDGLSIETGRLAGHA